MVKKIIAVFVLLCSLLCVGVNAFAWTDEDYQTLKNVYYDKQTDTYSNYVIWLNGKELYVIGNISDYEIQSNGKVWFFDSSDRCITSAYRIEISGADATGMGYGRPGPAPVYTTFLYSNMTFIDEDGTTVFPPPPVPTPVPTIPPGVEGVKMIPWMMVGNLQAILPVGLVALAVLLGVRLIPRLVGYFQR